MLHSKGLKLNSTIRQSPIFMNITFVLRKLGQASPCQLEYGMQVQAPLNLPSLLGHYSVANSSYNECTKSNPKICQIHTKFISVTKTFNLMLLFLQYLFIISRR